MFQKMLQGGGGGGLTLGALVEADTSQEVGMIKTYNGSYTATEDCVMRGAISSSSNYAAFITRVSESEEYAIVYGTNVKIGLNANIIGLFIPKGTTLYTRNRSDGSYDVKFYKLLN